MKKTFKVGELVSFNWGDEQDKGFITEIAENPEAITIQSTDSNVKFTIHNLTGIKKYVEAA